MVDKNDLDELEKWNTQRIINEKEKGKFHYEEFTKKNNVDKFSRVLKITGMTLRILAHIIVFCGIIIGLIFLYSRM